MADFIADATAITAFRRCPEYFRLRHRLHLVPDRIEQPLRAGQAFHAALAKWFADEGLDAAQEALRASWGEEDLLQVEEKRPRGLYEALLSAYADKWPRESDPFEVVHNERWLEATIGGFAYGAIVDRVVRLSDGTVAPMDTKTTGSYFSKGYFEKFRMSTQLIGQVALLQVLGLSTDSVAYVDAVHTDTRYHKVKPDHFSREMIFYPKHVVEGWARDIERTCEQILKCDGAPPILQNHWERREQGCGMWNRLCPYFDRCLTHPALADELAGFRIEPWEPRTLRENAE